MGSHCTRAILSGQDGHFQRIQANWPRRKSRTPQRLRPWCAIMADIGTALLCAACSSGWQICLSRRTYAQPAGSGNGPRKLAAEAHNLAASRPGLQWACSGCGFGHIRTADQECRGFSRSLHDTEPPSSSSPPLLPASHNRQCRAGDPSGGWSRSYSAVQSPGDRSASAMTTCTGAHDSIHLRIVS